MPPTNFHDPTSQSLGSEKDSTLSAKITDAEWLALKQRLARSAFRSRFKLRPPELKYLASHGWDAVEAQCQAFIRTRLAPAEPYHDGKQTPMRGHPGFIAQHATGCCCRGCLEKWHHIPKGRPLAETEINRIVSILMRWINEHADGIDELPSTPDLF